MIRDEFNKLITHKYQNWFEICLTLTHNKNTAYELLHHVLIDLLSKDETKLKKIYNSYKDNLFIYVYVAIMNQWKSTTSTFYKTYRIQNVEYKNDVIDEEYLYYEEKVNEIRKYVSKHFDWYDAQLWNLFYFYTEKIETEGLTKKELCRFENMRYRELQKITGINYESIRKTIVRVNEKIRLHFNAPKMNY